MVAKQSRCSANSRGREGYLSHTTQCHVTQISNRPYLEEHCSLQVSQLSLASLEHARQDYGGHPAGMRRSRLGTVRTEHANSITPGSES